MEIKIKHTHNLNPYFMIKFVELFPSIPILCYKIIDYKFDNSSLRVFFAEFF
jgi:hypothetical protein